MVTDVGPSVIVEQRKMSWFYIKFFFPLRLFLPSVTQILVSDLSLSAIISLQYKIIQGRVVTLSVINVLIITPF